MDVTLHLKDEASGLCQVCGANLQQRVSRWWLVNCWTADPQHYRASQTCHPAETVRPCGALSSSKPCHPDYPCRHDGRCQYAIDSGAEGLGHCPRGKCVMPEGVPQ